VIGNELYVYTATDGRASGHRRPDLQVLRDVSVTSEQWRMVPRLRNSLVLGTSNGQLHFLDLASGRNTADPKSLKGYPVRVQGLTYGPLLVVLLDRSERREHLLALA
jgi:hypothetical protein